MDADHGALNRFSGRGGFWRCQARGLGGGTLRGDAKGSFRGKVWGRVWRLLASPGGLAACLLHGFGAGDRPIEDMLSRAIHDHVARVGIPVDLQGATGQVDPGAALD